MGRSKKKSTYEAPVPENNEMYLNLEIDMQSLRGKNKELVETIAKIRKEKSILEKKVLSLQNEYYALHSKYVNLRNIFSTVDNTAKLCFPKVAEIVNQLTTIMRVCSVGSAITNTGDLKTQTVSPHRVNGTIIKSPTITLARFSNSPPMETSSRLSNRGVSLPIRTSGVNRNQETEPRPSTSRDFSGYVSNRQNDGNNISNRENEEINMDFVNRSRRFAVSLAPLNLEEDENEDENNMECAEEGTESGEEYCCPGLVTIPEESDDDYHNLSRTNSQYTETVREIRIYLSPIHNSGKKNTSIPNDLPDHFSHRTSSLSGEVSNTMNENSLLNESSRSDNKSVRFSFPNETNEKGLPFNLESSDWRNNGIDSFTFTNVSSIHKSPNVQDCEPSCSNHSDDSSKINAMERLGLTTTALAHQLATSTPVVSSPRTRLSRKSSSSTASQNITVLRNSKSNITKRKNSEEPNMALVVIKRLNLDKTQSPIKDLTKKLDVTPITSSKKIKPRYRRIKSLLSSSSSSDSDSTLAPVEAPATKPTVTKAPVTKAPVTKAPVTKAPVAKSPVAKVPVAKLPVDEKPVTKSSNLLEKKKGKENRKIQTSVIQVTKSSPRPKRSARPGSLREPSLTKKMRRSR